MPPTSRTSSCCITWHSTNSHNTAGAVVCTAPGSTMQCGWLAGLTSSPAHHQECRLPACAGTGMCLLLLLPLLQGSVLQCGLILGSSILFWAFRSGEADSYGYITH